MKASGSMPAMGTLRIYTTVTEIASAMSGAVPAIWIVQLYAFVVYLFLGAFYIGGVLGLLKTGSHGVFESWTTRKSLKNPYRRHSSYLYPLSRFFSKIRWVF